MHRSDDRLLGAGPQTTTASRSRSTIHAFAISGPGRSLVAALALALVMTGGDLLDRLHVAPPVPERAAAQAQEGQWDGPYSILPPELSILGAHVTVLPSGKILYWNTNYVDGAYARSQIWDPVLDVHTRIDAPQNRADENNVFCTGHAFLPDGRLLVTGGHLNWWNAAFGDWGAFRGLPYTNIFEPFDGALGTWSSAALPDMNAGRWYPTNTSLANGDVLVVSGTTEAEEPTVWNLEPQVWQVATGAWRNLASDLQVYYPWMFVDPKLGREGWVFEPGPDPQTRWLNTSGSGGWILGPLRDNPLAYPGVREYGSAVMYDDGQIVVIGGRGSTSEPTNTAEAIDLYADSPVWRQVSSMQHARRYVSATLLADGTILATGGTRGACATDTNEDDAYAVRQAEIWDPVVDTWRPAGRMQTARLYHSTAVLLPDARVVVIGGGEGGSCDGQPFASHPEWEFYSPPYLFAGPRPTLYWAPPQVTYGQEFQFWMNQDSATVAQVTLVRLPSVTHNFDQNQRFARLPITWREGGGLGGVRVQMPPRWEQLPPGYYMMFVLNTQGVPSEAHMLQVIQ